MLLRRGLFVLMLSMIVGGATDTTAQSNGPYSYGTRWKTWSASERSIYIDGFRDGQSRTYFKMVNDLPSVRREPLKLMTFTMYDTDALSGVMTDLYSDPANIYVQTQDMVYIARDKLSGKDVEPALRSARSLGSTPR